MIKKLIRCNEGNTTVIMAAVMILLLAMGGIVIDTGLLVEGKLKLHAATKAATQATIEAYDPVIWETQGKVVLEKEKAEEYVALYLNYNLPQARLVSVTILPESLNKAQVVTKLKVDFVFMKLFGIESSEVNSTITLIGG